VIGKQNLSRVIKVQFIRGYTVSQLKRNEKKGEKSPLGSRQGGERSGNMLGRVGIKHAGHERGVRPLIKRDLQDIRNCQEDEQLQKRSSEASPGTVCNRVNLIIPKKPNHRRW